MSDRPTPGSREDGERHHRWLYGDTPCLCDSAYRSLGRFCGVTMGKGWVRLSTHPDCPHHGTAAVARWRREHGRKAKVRA